MFRILEKPTQISGKDMVHQDEFKELSVKIERVFRLLNAYVSLSTTDTQGVITEASEAFCRMTGYEAAELIGQTHGILRHPDTPDEVYQELWAHILADKPWDGELKNRKKDGTCFWQRVQIEPMFDDGHEKQGYYAVHEDITQRKHLEDIVIKDELTGAYNRRYYNEIFNDEVYRAKRHNEWLAFLMVDIDNFKKYNDTYGHQAGDEALKAVARSLQKTFLRAGDLVFRMGGEEFAIIYNVQQKEHGLLMAEKARQAVYELALEHTGNPPHNRVTVSAGLMMIDPALSYAEDEIYKYADASLYRAKKEGRNCVHLHQPEKEIELF